MKIVIAPDSFKGSLTAREATLAISNGVLSVLPKAKIVEIPVADGGEGTMDSLVCSTSGYFKDVSVLDPLGREIKASYGVLGDGKTAIIEMSTASGITLLNRKELNPMLTTTYGTGQLIQKALNDGFRIFIICIGGSATNDCGTGMAQALGINFLDGNKNEILKKMCGEQLINVAFIKSSNINPYIGKSNFLVASDVKNPLLGENGCAHMYASQKGATQNIVEQLEYNMTSFISVAENSYLRSVRNLDGAGAAGGLGAGLMLFLNAVIRPGIDIVLESCDFQNRIKNTDLIITGEGKIDNQTLHGKTISGIARYAIQQKIPIIAFAGIVENVENIENLGISKLFSISTNNISIEKSIANASTLLQNRVASVIRKYYNKT